MAAMLRMPVFPALDTSGLPESRASVAEQFDPRAFLILETRDQAEALIRDDHQRGENDPEWTAYFVEAMVEFLVWQTAPAGRISSDDLEWLVAHMASMPSPSMGALLFALVRELNHIPEQLTALAMQHSRNRLRAWH